MAKQSNHLGARVLAAAIVCGLAGTTMAAPAQDNAPTNRFIVRFKADTNEHRSAIARQRVIEAAGMGQGLHVGKTRRLAIGADLVITDHKLNPKAAQAFMRKLRQDPRVEYVQVDRRMHRMLVPNDTRYTEQWSLSDNTSGIRAQNAWNVASGNGVVVAVLDTGITDHNDLGANIIAGYDFISADDDPAAPFFTANDGDGRDADAHDPGDGVAVDECGPGSREDKSSWHGTHVAGTVAALTNNAKGVAGVAFNAKVQPVRVLGRCGGYTSDIADAIIWASGGTVPNIPANPTPAEVINMSLGGGGGCDPVSQEAINIAVANGTTVVVAAGNDSDDAANHSPASCDNVVTVAATNKTGGKAGYSNTGDAVTLAAPGGITSAQNLTNGILSTLNAGTAGPAPASVEYYQFYAGTSMATPHVAGVAALMQSHAVNTPANVEAILRASARAFPASCVGCGSGLLTATDALTY
ncbi:MAG: S8 family peptidase, partial [Arenimonas sp.]